MMRVILRLTLLFLSFSLSQNSVYIFFSQDSLKNETHATTKVAPFVFLRRPYWIEELSILIRDRTWFCLGRGGNKMEVPTR